MGLSPSYAQPDSAAKLALLQEQLTEKHSLYGKVLMDKPNDKSAKRMHSVLSEALNALQAYENGTSQPDRIVQAAEAGTKEARRYTSENAREVARLFRELKSLGNGLPPNDAPERPAPQVLEDEAPEAAAEKPPVVVKTPGGAPDFSLWMLIAATLGGVVLVLAVLALLMGRTLARLRTRVAALQTQVDSLNMVQETGADFKDIQQQQAAKKLEQLEHNTTEILAVLEQRLAEVEGLSQRQSHTSQHLKADVDALQAQLEALRSLPGKLANLEAQLASPAPAAPAPNEPMLPPAVDAGQVPERVGSLLAHLRNLVESCPSALMKQRADLLMPGLRSAELTGSLAGLDFKLLAEVLQYAYGLSRSGAWLADYEAAAEAARGLGLAIEDRMTGRMAHSDHYAENLSPEAYATAARVHTEVFPPRGAVLQQLEANPVGPQTPRGMVLYTLHPGITGLRDGARVVLQKGVYIVNAS